MATKKLNVIITGDARDAKSALGAVDQQASGLSKTLKAAGAAFAGAFAVGGAISIFKGAFEGAEESAKVGKQTAQVIKTTGEAANVTAGQVATLAGAISKKTGVDDEAIQSASNMLLTFTSVRNEVGKGNDIFGQATQIVTDMSVALGKDLKGTSIQVGKALNDPIRGMSALTKMGVQFTAQQREQIKAMVESGDVMGAQKVILAELNTEFGGTAEAVATPWAKVKVAFENLQEELGTKLLPVIAAVSTYVLNTMLPWLDKAGAKTKEFAARIGELVGPIADRLTPAAQGLADVFASVLVPAVQQTVGWLTKNMDLVVLFLAPVTAVAAAYGVWAVATGAVTLAQTALAAILGVVNAVMAANPVVLVALALGALAVGVKLAYEQFSWFRAVVDGAWQALQTGFRWVRDNWPLLLAILTGPIGLAAFGIAGHIDQIVAFFKALPGRVGGVGSAIAGAIGDSFKGAWNGVARSINRIIPDKVGFGPFAVDLPDNPLPVLHDGGVFRAPRPGGEGLALLRDGERVLTPEQDRRGGGGGVTVNVAGSVVTERQLVLAIREGIRMLDREAS